MFPSSFPYLPALQLVLLVLLIAFVIWITSNPLALLALMFAWNPPPFVERNAQRERTAARSIGFHNIEDDESEDAVGDDE